eukprot:CAMPEP_0174310330 /NCGR_PEP_ID=MMETSP0810-20121108/2982_1 /TAXON_ID=73025 ORGANISM="Eutreptiella gymnastica-like, Strain CCMP1594" /NCGR_SAMPLE_ID=MMETSP0810 /ASSEMBLY_ACC=CAM_ASM_000659 /LENGTH=56 /DNA_ID=CAMNT_0015418215 /DNA_START=619 /DNA_END=791 /DNA_ORIENTATION=+
MTAMLGRGDERGHNATKTPCTLRLCRSGVAVGAGMRGGAIPPKRAIVAEPLAGLEA